MVCGAGYHSSGEKCLVVSIPGSEGEQGHQHEIQEGGQGNGQTGVIFLDRHLQVSESCCRKESVLTDHEG